MRPALIFFVIALLLCAVACGDIDSRAKPGPHALSRSQSFLSDGDNDNPADIDGDTSDSDPDNDNNTADSYNYHDRDDSFILNYGHAANAADTRAVTSVVKRYYAAAAVEDGSTACSLLLKLLARSVPEYYGQKGGLPYLRGGKTCQAVTTKLFKHFHDRLRNAIEVTGVRVLGDQAKALLGSTATPASDILLRREGTVWRLEVLLDNPLP